MKRFVTGFVIAVTVAAVVGAACAPTPVSAPAPAAEAPKTVPAPALSPEEAAWAQVVAAAKKEGTLTLYDYYLVGDVGLAVSRAFKERYGISVEIITGRGAEFNERLRTEQRLGKVMADILTTSATHAMTAKDLGLLAPTPDLPVLGDKAVWTVDVQIYDPTGQVFRWSPSHMTVYINTDQVKPGEEPRSLRDLLAPKWRGKITVHDPVVSSGAYLWLVPLLRGNIIDEEFLKALSGQQLKFATGSVQMGELLSRGEVPLSGGLSESASAKLVREGAPIRTVDVKEGSAGSSGGIGRVKGGPRPNAARLYLNWILSQEGQTVYSRANALAPLRKDVSDFTPKGAQVDLSKVVPHTAETALETSTRFREGYLTKLWKGQK